MTKSFYRRLLKLILWLSEQLFEFRETQRVIIGQVRKDGLVINGVIENMELRENQQVGVSVALKTRSGNPATYEKGSASWESSDESVATVEVDSADELKATVKGVNGSDNGSAVITFRADGDPDADETRDIVATLDVVVTQGEAFVAEITAGTPEDVPESTGGEPTEETPVV